jgi:uncharacterized protein (TIGR00255 family)
MTGFGRAERLFNNKQIVVEIRSVNGKSLDVGLKIPTVYRDKESEIRGYLGQVAQRGKVDVSVTLTSVQPNAKEMVAINPDVFKAYFSQIQRLMDEMHMEQDAGKTVNAILRLPDVLTPAAETLDEEEWKVIIDCFTKALDIFDRFRQEEGSMIMRDILQHIALIGQLLQQVDEYEPQRITVVKQHILSALALIPEGEYDKNRFEQELIYYMEKLDITEEKVRLQQHCNYFSDTAKEEASGRKLGFITQEIGREINTLGSKANHAGIQKIVVQMKDELEKVKEQLLNVL